MDEHCRIGGGGEFSAVLCFFESLSNCLGGVAEPNLEEKCMRMARHVGRTDSVHEHI